MEKNMSLSRTIPDAFRELAKKQPRKTAVVYLGTEYSYSKVDELSDSFAASLAQSGIKPGDKVMMFLPNSIGFVVSWLGILKAGAIAVPITPIYTSADVTYIANDTQAKAIVCVDRNYGHVVQSMSESTLELAIVSTLVDLLPAWKRLFGWIADIIPTGKVSNESHTIGISDFLKQSGKTLPDISIESTDLAEILYTGGTTRHPKGVPITHEMLRECSAEQLSVPKHLFDPKDNVLMGSAPLFHILGQACGLGTLFTHGGTIITQPRVNLDAMMDGIARYKANTLIGVPALFRMILEHDRIDFYDLSSLKYCFTGGDVLPEELWNRWKRKLGQPIYVGYGATETVAGISLCPTNEDNPPGSMGYVLKSKEVKLVETDSVNEVKQGEAGELLVHSNPMVEAYWNKPEETKEAFVKIDGKLFYRTGDIITMDEKGRLFFKDRTADTIKHKGYRISASEIECTLQDHHAVTACCVIGLPDEKVGERIKAFVVLKKDIKGVTSYDLIKHCKSQLASYKIPQYIEFRDMLPKSKVGKLLRREIRSEEASRQEG